MPTPQPKPKAPTAKGYADQGWGKVTSNPDKAVGLFQKSLQVDANYADANYGMGYVLLQLGRAAEAKPYLCKAKALGDTEIRRDVGSMLANNNLSCP